MAGSCSEAAVRSLPSLLHRPLGTRHKAPTTFEARIDAQGWLAGQHRAIQNQTWEPPSAAKPKVDLFAGYAEAWLSSRDLKPNTVLHYRWALDSHILPTFGDVPVKKITPATVRDRPRVARQPGDRTNCEGPLLRPAQVDPVVSSRG